MGVITFRYKTIIHAPRQAVWSFFQSATNLTTITSFPKVEIISSPEIKPGNKIEMQLSFLKVKMTWVSLIKYVEPPYRFMDKGIIVPYPIKTWTHKHTFHQKGADTIMVDTVECSAFIPNMIVRLVLHKMFQNRAKNLIAHFTN